VECVWPPRMRTRVFVRVCVCACVQSKQRIGWLPATTTRIPVATYVREHVRTCMCACTHTRTHARMHVRLHGDTARTRMDVRTHPQTHTTHTAWQQALPHLWLMVVAGVLLRRLEGAACWWWCCATAEESLPALGRAANVAIVIIVCGWVTNNGGPAHSARAGEPGGVIRCWEQ